MIKITPDSIRAKVLKERGITRFQPEKGKHRKLKPVPQPTNAHKTPLMRYFELVHGELIEQILLSGSLSVVAKRLDNEVDVSTLSKWIKRLKLRYTPDNMPQCDKCPVHQPACDLGTCYILLELELYNLLRLKREEIIG